MSQIPFSFEPLDSFHRRYLEKYFIAYLKFQLSLPNIRIAILSTLGGLKAFLDDPNLVTCFLHNFRAQHLPFTNFVLVEQQSTLVPIQHLIRSDVDTRLISIVVGELH